MHSLFTPSMRLHLWLENERGALIGLGRAMLLARIKECGSLRQAAESLGISYRAAWGKIRQAQLFLGQDLVHKEGKGYVLTEFGEDLAKSFLKWHDEVERLALVMAQDHFPWPVQPYRSASDSPASVVPTLSAATNSLSSPTDSADKEHS